MISDSPFGRGGRRDHAWSRGLPGGRKLSAAELQLLILALLIAWVLAESAVAWNFYEG